MLQKDLAKACRRHRTSPIAPALIAVCAVLWGAFVPAAQQPSVAFVPAPPHDAAQCSCHTLPPAKAGEPSRPPGHNPFVPEESTLTERCMSCHKRRCAHPSDVVAASGSTTLPLGRQEIASGKVLCSTCHDLHGARSAPFLRSLGPPDADGTWPACDGCHPPKRYMVHGKTVEGAPGECAVCHPTPPNSAEVALNAGFERVCFLCHPRPPVSCLNAVRPQTPGILARQIKDIALPVDEGRLNCGSCHRVMDPPDGRNLLRPEYAAFRKEVAIRNIHRSGLLCSPCHGVEVRKGERKPVLLEKDPEKMCRACHDNQLARGDIHPSGVVARVTEHVSIPGRFPLYEGRMVCTTCHVVCRMWEERHEGTSVRGGPFQSREDACFQCHNAEGYTRFNPHRQIDDSGKVEEKVCLYCHSSVADRTVQGMDKVSFVADLKTYCIGCHEKSLRHPVNVRHVGAKPGEGMAKRIKAFEQEHNATFPRGPNGELLCFTCHNPHQEGVLSGKAAVESMYHRLRNTSQYEVCNACHGGGGLK